MKFNLIGFHERYYKIVSLVLVVGLTASSIMGYQRLEDKSDTFVIATMYALVLFAVGIYLTNMDKKISDKFYDRKDFYLNLKRLEEVFKSNSLEEYSDKSVFSSIMSFQAFTARASGLLGMKPYVSEKGFIFQYDDLKIEDEFIKARSDLINKLQNEIQSYIYKNDIKIQFSYVGILDIYEFDVDKWCDENILGDEEQIEGVKTHIYNYLEILRPELDNVEILMKNINDLYSNYLSETIGNLKMIEKVYGKRLLYEIDKENRYIETIYSLQETVVNANRTMCSKEEYKKLADDIRECRYDIKALGEQIKIVEENIVSTVEVCTDEINRI